MDRADLDVSREAVAVDQVDEANAVLIGVPRAQLVRGASEDVLAVASDELTERVVCLVDVQVLRVPR